MVLVKNLKERNHLKNLVVDLVNIANLVNSFLSMFIYFLRVHVSGDYVHIIIPDSHPYTVTSTKCRINAVVSPDDGHIVARNM